MYSTKAVSDALQCTVPNQSLTHCNVQYQSSLWCIAMYSTKQSLMHCNVQYQSSLWHIAMCSTKAVSDAPCTVVTSSSEQQLAKFFNIVTPLFVRRAFWLMMADVDSRNTRRCWLKKRFGCLNLSHKHYSAHVYSMCITSITDVFRSLLWSSSSGYIYKDTNDTTNCQFTRTPTIQQTANLQAHQQYNKLPIYKDTNNTTYCQFTSTSTIQQTANLQGHQ